MYTEIINGDWEVFNDDKTHSVTIAADSLEQRFFDEYTQDVAIGMFIGSFEEWASDHDACTRYLKELTAEIAA